jgi:hypothetical protein
MEAKPREVAPLRGPRAWSAGCFTASRPRLEGTNDDSTQAQAPFDHSRRCDLGRDLRRPDRFDAERLEPVRGPLPSRIEMFTNFESAYDVSLGWLFSSRVD